MSALLLPPASRAVAPYAGPRPEATSLAWVLLESRYGKAYHRHVVGCIAYHPNDLTDPHSQLGRWRRRLAICTPLGCSLTSVALSAKGRERRTLDELQRFRRKMGQVLHAYEAEKAKALRGELGLPELALERLEEELEQAWQKAERIYGCKREEFNPTTNP